jgi:acyl carrier protein
MRNNCEESTKARLVECFSAVFPALSQEEIVSAKQAELAQWDSLATVNLMMLVEEQFKTFIPPEQFEELVSFDVFLEFLGRAEVDAER